MMNQESMQDNVMPQNPQVYRVDDHSGATRRSTRDAVQSTNSTVAHQRDHSASIAAGQSHAREIQSMLTDMSSVLPSPVSPVIEQPTVRINKPVDQPAKKVLLADLSDLINVGRIEREFIVNNYKFRMHTLNNEENEKAMQVISQHTEPIIKVSAIRTSLLALAIDKVNGVTLESLYVGSESNISSFEKKKRIIDSWQQIFTQKIFEEYDKMMQESDKVTKNSEEELKN